MCNAGIVKVRALWTEAETSIEGQRLRLRIQFNMPMPVSPGHRQHQLQERSAHPVTTPCGNNGQAPDMPVRKQTAGADRASAGFRERMLTIGICFIPFQGFGYALLCDEHRFADRSQRRSIAIPVGLPHGELTGRMHRRIIFRLE